MNADAAKKLRGFQEEIKSEGERVVFTHFPEKILELSKFLEETSTVDSVFNPSNVLKACDTSVYPPSPSGQSPNSSEPSSKKRKRLNGATSNDNPDSEYSGLECTIKSNDCLVHIHSKVKKEAETLAGMLDKLRLWVTLTMPKIEDGDNFGVQIQEEVLSEIQRGHETCLNLRDSARQDHAARAKVCSKRLKYPNIEDYEISIREHDERQAFQSRQYLFDIRNTYMILADFIYKNIAKIRAPKGNNSASLY